MEEALVSVIIPTWNRRELLKEAIASVFAQTYRRFEILVMDDGSQDGTAEMLCAAAHPEVRHFAMPNTGSISMLRNVAFTYAHGEYIAFLDSDDLWRPEKLEVQVGALKAHEQAGFAYTGFETFDCAGNSRITLYRRAGGPEQTVQNIFAELIAGGMGPYPSAVLMRARAVVETGPIDEGMRMGEYEFFSRLAWRYPAVVIHAPLVRIRKHPGNISRFASVGLGEAILTVERAYRAGRVPRSVLQDRILNYRGEMARLLLEKGDAAGARRELEECLALLEIGVSA